MDQFERFKLLVGNEDFDKIKNQRIVVLGVGGVGSFVVESLVRSGVENITIIDFDVIDITNLNRQLMTNLDNIGKSKVDEIEKRALKINKNIKIKKIKDFITPENIDNIFIDDIDYFIDCCDSIKTKEAVILKCLEKRIKFITCCGMGRRLDPSKIEIQDLKKTSYDPLAKKLREFMNKNKINKRIICCCSKEQPIKSDNKTISSNSFVPSSAGLLITSYIIRNILGDNNARL